MFCKQNGVFTGMIDLGELLYFTNLQVLGARSDMSRETTHQLVETNNACKRSGTIDIHVYIPSGIS